MASKALEVKFTANTADLEHGLKRVGEGVHHLAEAFLVFEAVKKVGEFLKDSIEAAAKDQAAMAILGNQVKAAGENWDTNSKAVSENLEKMSEASGFIKSDLATGLGRLETATHSLTKSQQLLGQAQDLARARGMSVVDASQLLAKVYNGNTGAARRLGLQVDLVTHAQDRLKAKHMELIASGHKLTDAQKLAYEQDLRDAKAKDKQASGLSTLTALQKQFSGASQDYANTGAGALARLQAIWESLQVQIGDKFLPVLAKLGVFLANNLPVWIAKLNAEWLKIQPTVMHFIAILQSHLPQAIALVQAKFKEFVGFVTTVWNRWGTDLIHIVQHIVAVMVPILKAAFELIKIIVLTAAALLEGHWGAAWDRIKQIPGKAIDFILTVLHGAANLLRMVVEEISHQIARAFLSGLSALGGMLAGVIKGAFNYGVIDPANALINKLVNIEKDIPGSPNLGIGPNPIPRLAAGGIVTRPTLAIIGESGPEAVVPLGAAGAGGVNVYVAKTHADPREIGAAVSWALRTA